MNLSGLISIYALLILVGGIIGYIKAASLPSLISGLVAAVLLLICSYGISSRWLLGYIGAGLITLALTCFFAFRFVNSGFTAWMPAGIMAICSLAVFIGILLLRKH